MSDHHHKDRQKIAAKIAALKAKTVANGATPDEAIAAAMKLRELQDKYDMTLSEAELLAEGFRGDVSATVDPESFTIQYEIMHGLAAFTQTRVFTVDLTRERAKAQGDFFGRHTVWEERKHESLYFVGLKGDVIFAVWLAQTLEAFIKRGATSYIASLQGSVKRSRGGRVKRASLNVGWGDYAALSQQELLEKRNSYIVGAARRINERLLTEALKHQHSKHPMIDAELARRGAVITTKDPRAGMRAADAAAYRSGDQRGNEASFGKPVNAGGGVHMLT